MAYSKPKTLAKSAKKSSFSAGCPSDGVWHCKDCEVTR